MDKEKLITIGIGLAMGISAATVYFLAVRFLPAWQNRQNKVTFSPTNNQQQTATNGQFSLTIDSPDDHTSTTDGTLSVSGKTNPGARLIIFANAEEKVASADGQGKFSPNIKLEDGENEISITAINDQGNVVVAKRNITLEISQ